MFHVEETGISFQAYASFFTLFFFLLGICYFQLSLVGIIYACDIA